MCLCKYYNAKINVEATRIGFLNWAKHEGLLSYFMKRPKATLTDIRNGSTKQYGTPATTAIIEMQTDLIATFVEDYCHTIWFEDILSELQNIIQIINENMILQPVQEWYFLQIRNYLLEHR